MATCFFSLVIIKHQVRGKLSKELLKRKQDLIILKISYILDAKIEKYLLSSLKIGIQRKKRYQLYKLLLKLPKIHKVRVFSYAKFPLKRLRTLNLEPLTLSKQTIEALNSLKVFPSSHCSRILWQGRAYFKNICGFVPFSSC